VGGESRISRGGGSVTVAPFCEILPQLVRLPISLFIGGMNEPEVIIQAKLFTNDYTNRVVRVLL